MFSPLSSQHLKHFFSSSISLSLLLFFFGISPAGAGSLEKHTNSAPSSNVSISPGSPSNPAVKAIPGKTPSTPVSALGWTGDEPRMLLSELNDQLTKGQVSHLILSETPGENTEVRVVLNDQKRFIVLFPNGFSVADTLSSINKKKPPTQVRIEVVRSFSSEQPEDVGKSAKRWQIIHMILNKIAGGLPTLLFFALLIVALIWLQLKATGWMSRLEKRKINPCHLTVSFDDVAGVDEAKADLKEVIDFLNQKTLYNQFGARIPKGVLLVGDPGNGKTMLAKAAAKACNASFYSVSGSEFVGMFLGLGTTNVRALFKNARKNKRSIIFIDEIDAIGESRGGDNTHHEVRQTLNQLLIEMDGFNSSKHDLLVIAATNRPEILDEALLRPGRFDRHISVDRPSQKGRIDILRVHLEKAKVDISKFDLSSMAGQTVGFSGAELANLVNEAMIHAARRRAAYPDQQDLVVAREKILMGDPRHDMRLLEQERWLTAVHEAGHGAVALAVSDIPVEKITIVPRKGSLGMTVQVEELERFSMAKKRLESQLQVLMGGRAAEELLLDDITTGAGNDMARAFDMAFKMVAHWGMGSTLGTAAAEQPQKLSEGMRILLEQEATDIVKKHYVIAQSILKEHKPALEKIAEALLEKESLDRSEVLDIWLQQTRKQPLWAATADSQT